MKSMPTVFVAGLAASLAFGSAASADAASSSFTGGTLPTSNIVKIQAGGGDMDGRFQRGFDRRSGASSRSHRGGRDWRSHRRNRNDWIPPAAALLGGLIIGGAIANSAAAPYPYASSYTNPHIDWCFTNTPAYNPYDNTYEAYYSRP